MSVEWYNPVVVMNAIMQSIAERRWTLIHMMYPRPDHWSRARRLQLSVTAQQPLQFALAEGFQMHLTKPVAPAELIIVIASVARRTRM